MNKEELIQWWTYLLKDITRRHASAWFNEILRTQGREEAELFVKRVNWINKKKIL